MYHYTTTTPLGLERKEKQTNAGIFIVFNFPHFSEAQTEKRLGFGFNPLFNPGCNTTIHAGGHNSHVTIPTSRGS